MTKLAFKIGKSSWKPAFYQHILDELQDLLQTLPEEQTILDVACGEGYYARKIQEKFPNKEIYAFDLSKDSIQLAAKAIRALL